MKYFIWLVITAGYLSYLAGLSSLQVTAFTKTLKHNKELLQTLRCHHRIGYNPFSPNFLWLHPSINIFHSTVFIEYSSIFISKRWGNSPVLPARTPTTFCARFPPRRSVTRPSRLTSDAPGRIFPSSPPACRRHDSS